MNRWNQTHETIEVVRRIEDLIRQLDLNMQQGPITVENLEQVGLAFMLLREKRNTLDFVKELINSVNSDKELEDGN